MMPDAGRTPGGRREDAGRTPGGRREDAGRTPGVRVGGEEHLL